MHTLQPPPPHLFSHALPFNPSLMGLASHKPQEAKSDDQIRSEVMSSLRAVFPGAPDPVDVQITRWGQNK